VPRASEASYRAIFETAEDAILIHDWDTNAMVDVNPKACETYGYSHEEMRHAHHCPAELGVPPYTQEDALRHVAEAKRAERCASNGTPQQGR
jgi:PAS domain S-box-containing protein